MYLNNLKRVWMIWKVSVRSKQCPDHLENVAGLSKILQNHLLSAFGADLKIDAIYALYPESFCDKNLAIRKVFAFCDSECIISFKYVNMYFWTILFYQGWCWHILWTFVVLKMNTNLVIVPRSFLLCTSVTGLLCQVVSYDHHYCKEKNLLVSPVPWLPSDKSQNVKFDIYNFTWTCLTAPSVWRCTCNSSRFFICIENWRFTLKYPTGHQLLCTWKTDCIALKVVKLQSLIRPYRDKKAKLISSCTFVH